MRIFFISAGVCLALCGHTPAYGQAGALFNAFQVDASVPLQFSTNTLLTPTNARSDFWSSPSFKLSALGSVNSSLAYQIYFSSNPEPYWRVRAAEDGFETFGAKFDKTLNNGFDAGGYYEHSFVFNGLYQSTAFQANDFAGFVGYLYDDSKKSGFSFAPVFTVAYRAADDVSQDRFLLNLKTVITQQLTKEWSFVLTPWLRYYAFTNGTSTGEWRVFPSMAAELDYAINKDVTLAGSIEFDRQWSNFAANNFTNVTVLASITFGHKYDLPPKKQMAEWRKTQ